MFKYKLFVNVPFTEFVIVSSEFNYETFIVELAHRRWITADNGNTYFPTSFLALEKIND